MATWYILLSFWYIFSFWDAVPRKNLATLLLQGFSALAIA
jgi:hypothetical protein